MENQILNMLEDAKNQNDTMKIIELQDKYIQLLQQKNDSLELEIMQLWKKITKLLKCL